MLPVAPRCRDCGMPIERAIVNVYIERAVVMVNPVTVKPTPLWQSDPGEPKTTDIRSQRAKSPWLEWSYEDYKFQFEEFDVALPSKDWGTIVEV